MPEPDWVKTDYDPWERPDIGSEIIGRGLQQRKSKTFLQSVEHGALLGFVRGHIRMLIETFRELHAAHYMTTIVVEDEDGNEVKETVPHVLSDEEVMRKYPVVGEWENLHQEHVDHMVSVSGFSVRAASGYEGRNDDRVRRRGSDSSAGTDGRQAQDGGRWR